MDDSVQSDSVYPDDFQSIDQRSTLRYDKATATSYVANDTGVNDTNGWLNATTPSDGLPPVDEEPATSWIQLVTVVSILVAIALCAIVGNVLVIASVATDRRLRTITNRFVVSLATADLTVALLVLPPAVKMEITGGRWLLGRALCDVWISFDVMLCTASILNLCCISIDRYLAVTRPLQSATGWRSKRLANVMIAVVWIAAVVITCPPLLGWQEAGRDRRLAGDGRNGFGGEKCELTRDPGYVIYSALGSFYVPLAVMLFVYANIFKVVRSRGLQTGSGSKLNSAELETSDAGLQRRTAGSGKRNGCPKQQNANSMKMVPLNSEKCSASRPTVGGSTSTATDRRHRFNRSGMNGNRGALTTSAATGHEKPTATTYLRKLFHTRANRSKSSTSTSTSARTPSSTLPDGLLPPEVGDSMAIATDTQVSSAGVEYELVTSRDRFHDRIEQLVDEPSSTRRFPDDEEDSLGDSYIPMATRNGRNSSSQSAGSDAETVEPFCPTRSNCNRRGAGTSGSHSCWSDRSSDGSLQQQTPPPVGSSRRRPHHVDSPHQNPPASSSLLRTTSGWRSQVGSTGQGRLLQTHGSGSCERSAVRREGKTAKTLSIVVGGFIVCWLPFFILYVVEPFCSACPPVSPHLRSFLTWLGYANSLVNPFIYAYYNPFFRQSFWRLTFGFCCSSDTGNTAVESTSRRCCRNQRRAADGNTSGGHSQCFCCYCSRRLQQCLRFRRRSAEARTVAATDCGKSVATCGRNSSARTTIVVNNASRRNPFTHKANSRFHPEVGDTV